MDLLNNLHLFANYNQTMNTRLYQLASELPAATIKENKGAFFGSIQNTLNHLLVGDILWLRRFSKHPAQFPTLVAALEEFPTPTALDQLLYEDFSEQFSQRKKLDAIIIDWVHTLKSEHLAHDFSYRSMAGDFYVRNFGSLIMHMFNHQTHHRGQTTTLLSQCGLDIGATDFLGVIPSAA